MQYQLATFGSERIRAREYELFILSMIISGVGLIDMEVLEVFIS
jgi:hypothetical protein